MPRHFRLGVRPLEQRITPDATPHNLLVSNFYQNWNDASIITANDNWSGVSSVVGYLGDATIGEGVNPQLILTPFSMVHVLANQGTNTALTTGGVAEFDGLGMIALQPDGTADAPNLVVTINTTGRSNIVISYNLRDIDGTADNANQPVALQYRIGTVGNFVNVLSGFVADATTGPSLATKVTPVNVTLPSAVDNQSIVEVRIITSNAFNNDEWVGVDDFVVGSKDILVNSMPYLQHHPAVAIDRDGGAFVAWASKGPDGSGYGIRGQRFDNEGQKIGSEFQVNTFTTGNQHWPSVAMDADGNAFVTWYGAAEPVFYDIYAQRFDAAGNKVGEEFQVNSYTTGKQYAPSVAVDADGDAIVVWRGGLSGLSGQRIDKAGTKVGVEFAINTFANKTQDYPCVVMDSDGDALVVWQSYHQDGDSGGIYGQRFDSTGNKVGLEFQINTYTSNIQRNPSVAMDVDGDVLVVWSSYGQDGSQGGVFGQRLNSAGDKVNSEFLINSHTTGHQRFASVAMDADGDAIVVWESYQDSSSYGIYGQRLNAAGAKVGVEFQLNTYAPGSQRFPMAALDPVGDVIAVWLNYYDIFAQRFRSPNPPVRFANIQINDGSPQRSLVTSVQINFDSPVSFTGSPSAAFTLFNQKTTNPVALSAVVDPSGKAVTLTFTGGSIDVGGSLADGLYTLTIFGNQFTGNGFDGNGDGIPGDNYTMIGTPANGLFRLFGDADGNGSVTAADFNAFRLVYGTSGPSFFDFDNDGQTSAADFNQFRLRYGVII